MHSMLFIDQEQYPMRIRKSKFSKI